MLKILQVRLQQYINQELSDVQAEFREGGGIRDQTDNILWITEKAQEFQENTYFCFTGYAKAFGWIATNYGKFFKRREYQTTLPVSCETISRSRSNRIGHGTTDWFQIGKGVHQACILSPCLTYMQSTSCEMLGFMNHKLESRVLGEISITSDM